MKYRNADFVLREMKRLQDSSEISFNVEIKHEVNAILTPNDASGCLPKAHVVIFNHPHLGTEDAKLHSQFLCHLFHSVERFWLLDLGVFYLTLVKGQFDRWECERAAKRHGMMLLVRCFFAATPSVIPNPAYEHRRHQTGKSFASRTSGSETFKFVRITDHLTGRNNLPGPKLPWFCSDADSANTDMITLVSDRCLYCSKTFRDERSMKNHVNSKHSADSLDNKRKRLDDNDNGNLQEFRCDLCPFSGACPRSFESFGALQDHIRAKHDAIHPAISPDWSSQKADRTAFGPLEDLGSCAICGHAFTREHGEKEHFESFVPSEIRPATDASLQCRFCAKSFRQTRSRLQHENLCSHQPACGSRTS